MIADGKRGDVAVTAAAYAQALAGATPTVAGAVRRPRRRRVHRQPAAGHRRARAADRRRGAGVFVLVRTSNPGAADVQDLELAGGERAVGAPRAARRRAGRGPRSCGLSDVGAVIGATAPEHLARARELMPHAIFLLPGVGAAGRPRRGPRAGVRAGARRRARQRLARDRRTRTRPRGGDPADAALARGRAAARARLVARAGEPRCRSARQ